MFSMMLALELKELAQNMQSGDSSLFSEPVLFTGSIFETIARISYFFIPLVIGIAAIKEKNVYLKFTYIIGVLALILTQPIIEKIGFSSLYAVKSILIFIAVVSLMNYLNKTVSLYKKVLKKVIR